jgi:hypothetical protein
VIPAIPPRDPSADPSQPAIAREDVERYVVNFRGAHRIGATPGTIKVTSITFATAARLDDKPGFGVPPDTILCVAEATGDFTVTQPFPGSKAHTHTLRLTFDARTGYLLRASVGP